MTQSQARKIPRGADPEALTTPQAAEYIDAHPGTLAKWRQWGGGPRFIKRRGHRVKIVYRQADLDDFLEPEVSQ